MKTLDETMQMLGGSFLYPQVLLILIILILGIQKFIRYFRSGGPSVMPFHRSHHAILFLGIFGFVWGIFTQLVGIVTALNAIIEAADVSPALMFQGLRNSFISPVIGLSTLLFSALIWGILQAKFSSFMKGRNQSL